MIDLTQSPDKLKASILQDAMQGELTNQLPEDGITSDLLKSIEVEKQRLIDAGKIKKQKALPDIDQDEIPFTIPKNWQWVRLNDVGQWKSGSTPKRSHPEYYGGNIPWLKTGDLNDGIINETSETITNEGLNNTSLNVNPVGSVLIAMYGATIAKLGILDIPSTTNQACCACVVYKGIYNRFIFYYLMSQRRNFIALGSGGAQPNISRTKIIQYLIPVPPLSEQKRIVTKLDELLPQVDSFNHSVNKIHDLREQLPIKLRKSFLQSAMQGKLTNQLPTDGNASDLLKSIEDEKQRLIDAGKIKKQKALPDIDLDEVPFTIPDNWQWCRFGNLVEIISGRDVPKVKQSSNDSFVPYITGASNIRDGVIKTNTYIEKPLVISKKDDLLLTVKGTIGKMAFMNKELAHIARQIMAIRFIYNLNPYYVYFVLSMFKSKLVNSAKSMIPGIRREDLLNLPFPLPPLEEQKQIVNKLDSLFAKLDNLE